MPTPPPPRTVTEPLIRKKLGTLTKLNNQSTVKIGL